MDIVEFLTHELTEAGQIINTSNTKILSTDLNTIASETPLRVEVPGTMVKVVVIMHPTITWADRSQVI